jgi:F0F1-type ATP synthase assembly protein I
VNKVGRKWAVFVEKWPLSNVTSSDMLAAMEPSRPTFEPAGAGMLLSATTAASVGVGALVGWVAGSVGYGILGGAIVGVPAGIAAVYFRYREALS